MHFYFVASKNEKSWIKNGELYQAIDDIFVTVKDHDNMYYEWHLLPGFLTDGGSVPRCFRWFVPSWSKSNHVLNLAFALHDAAYASALLDRNDADDLVRGLLRDAGLCRLRASTVCYAVNKFAEDHYGPVHDKYGSAPFVKLRRWRP